MALMNDSEREWETREFKERWDERALETAAAFANTKGGTISVGIRDDGTAIGFNASDVKVRQITDQIVNVLGILPNPEWRLVGERRVLDVRVSRAGGLVCCKGRYLGRVGSTNRDLSLDEMSRIVLERSGQTWDAGLLSEGSSVTDIDQDEFGRFLEQARPRLPQIGRAETSERVLLNLDLMDSQRLRRGGVLLFGTRGQLFPAARVHLGRFLPGQILGDQTVEGNLFEQLRAVLGWLRLWLRSSLSLSLSGSVAGSSIIGSTTGVPDRYIVGAAPLGASAPGAGGVGVAGGVNPQPEGIEALQRRDEWEYPFDALREAIINALIHRDYGTPGQVEVRAYEDRLEIWNPGSLPAGLVPADLEREGHASRPRNPRLAQAFYYAGLVEKWGTGTTRMIAACQEQGLPGPEFSEDSGGFRVTFRKDPYTRERLRSLGLNERQVQAMLFVKQNGDITNVHFQTLSHASDRTAARDLRELVARGLLRKLGTTGRATRYVLAIGQNTP